MRRARYLVVIAISLGACGDDGATDVDDVTRQLEGDVQRQTGTRDVQVMCEDDVSEGDVCDVTAAGGLDAQVRITRLEDGEVQGEVVQP
jgi:hypothetical protein